MEELIQWGADFNAQESWGQTPLIIATLKNRVECMKLLIHRGADTEVKDHHHGNTPLHIACASKDEETILILLDAAADVMATNSLGQSALGVALANKAYTIVPLLMEYGARLNQRDREHLPLRLQNYIDNLTGKKLAVFQHLEVNRTMLNCSDIQLYNSTKDVSAQLQTKNSGTSKWTKHCREVSTTRNLSVVPE